MKWFAAVGVLFPNPADGFASEPTRAKKSRFIFSVCPYETKKLVYSTNYMEYTYEIWAILLLDVYCSAIGKHPVGGLHLGDDRIVFELNHLFTPS